MDVEKTVEFILDQQAKFEAGMTELRQAQQKTEQGLDRLGRLVEAYAQAGSIQMQLHRERMDAHEAWMKASEARQTRHEEEFQGFLKRFDDFVRHQRGANGQ